MDMMVRSQLEHQIGQLEEGWVAGRGRPGHVREPFSRWLLVQTDRGDWIDQLADAARKDRGFPRAGTPEDVRAHLVMLGADADTFEQLEDAERCWLSL